MVLNAVKPFFATMMIVLALGVIPIDSARGSMEGAESRQQLSWSTGPGSVHPSSAGLSATAGCGLVGDMQPDGVVDTIDLGVIGNAWGTAPGDAGWCAACDLDPNNKINVVDLILAAMHLGDKCVSGPFGADMGVTGITAAGGLTPLEEANNRWVRVAIDWSQVEGDGVLPPGSPTYSWGSYDNWFSNAAGAGMVPIAIVGYRVPLNYRAVGWSGINCGLLSSAGMDRFEEFLEAAAERYDGDGIDDAPDSPVVEYWELGNEPDSTETSGSHFGLCYGNYGDEYAELLRTAWSALHSDPNRDVHLVFGGIAHENCCSFNINFLDDVLDYIQNHPLPSGEEYFDVMNFHGYSSFLDGYSPPSILGKTQVIRNELAARSSPHLQNKPLMLTEAGRRNTSDQTAWGRPGTDARQSRYATQLFARSIAADLEATIWFATKDFIFGNPPTVYGYGLLEDNNDRKDSYWAYKGVVDELAGYAYDAAVTGSVSWPSPVEGHGFTDGAGNEKWVVFIPPQDEGTTRTVSFPFSKIKVVDYDKFNSTYPTGAGDPSKTQILCGAGSVDVTITADPIYVEPNPPEPCP